MKALPIILVLAMTTGFAQQGTIRGTLSDAKTGQVVPGASVSLVGTMRGTSAGPDGHFILRNVLDGTYTLAVSMVGYQRAVTPRLMVTAATVLAIIRRITALSAAPG